MFEIWIPEQGEAVVPVEYAAALLRRVGRPALAQAARPALAQAARTRRQVVQRVVLEQTIEIGPLCVNMDPESVAKQSQSSRKSIKIRTMAASPVASQ